MKSFREKVYAAARRVPRGRVTTYKALARAIGAPRAARAVGNALNKNPHAPKVPCHRVILSSGKIGGYASGERAKIKRLITEGVLVEKNRVDLNKFGFKI
ncbi:MAG: methylated-DNA-protein-cysteine methyltransferase [Candidatus Jorgensenbacteria bacterium GW2011_GWA1_48_13]|uniref:Methylated-DNA-protein-cysteine methyltransferase n=2 Tax=Candidatus Joergenseniibacteriota TaxID=1752739 RepID=A0A0G1W948_9BACT|nr:MAG: methylated-DNA-protein-cysteine methyltransferase [Candidatus Jorgensenbacteria bacterium GW2011_GWA1_48_13]KKU98843.1 MAG: methylated-DNA-protein-cysteine methyltransferase [Candidatus Jorgensenbacteria bacterium GW2011_GWC1_48_8]KKW15326.1 MAG: methylated-DNA-protein-cysteine methyltransferase [Candidatus Jorgensenbacteria bacterium GW2011_GWB1_50_10]